MKSFSRFFFFKWELNEFQSESHKKNVNNNDDVDSFTERYGCCVNFLLLFVTVNHGRYGELLFFFMFGTSNSFIF